MSDAAAADATVPEPKPRRAPRWMWIALTVSLAANLLVVGALAGSLWALKARPPVEGAGLSANIGGFMRSLPRERRRALFEGSEDVRERFRALRQEAQAKRRAALAVMTAEPFEPARFAAAHQEAVAVEDRLRALSAEVFLRFAGSLSPQERKAFAEWRERHPHGRRGERGERGERARGGAEEPPADLPGGKP